MPLGTDCRHHPNGRSSAVKRSRSWLTPSWTLQSLPVDEETKTLLREGMQFAQVEDVVTFLVGAARKEANLVIGQQKRKEQSLYESLPPSDLSRIKLPEATEER